MSNWVPLAWLDMGICFESEGSSSEIAWDMIIAPCCSCGKFGKRDLELLELVYQGRPEYEHALGGLDVASVLSFAMIRARGEISWLGFCVCVVDDGGAYPSGERGVSIRGEIDGQALLATLAPCSTR
eukprot:2679773-Amphidinium_carterae.7